MVEGVGTTAIPDSPGKMAVDRAVRPFDLVVVAMAPASEEVEKGMPMVGPSGRYLRKTLSQLGVDDYYVTNCLCCPIPNDAPVAAIREAQSRCRERLTEEITSRRPKLILALGDMPLQEFCGPDYKVLENEGRLLMSQLNIPLVPVAHPAYYLRRPDEAFDFLECMRAGIRYLNNNYHQVGEVSHTIIDASNLEEARRALAGQEYLTIDLETSGFEALGLSPDHILEVGVGFEDDHCYVIPPEFLHEFKDIIEHAKMIGWNAFFDARFLKAVGIHPYIYFDGMLAHYCLDERQNSHGLKKVARTYIGAGDWEANIKQYLKNPKKDSYEVIPEDVRRAYLAKDVCYTHVLWKLLREEVKDNWVFWNILMPATRVFTETMFQGVRIDPYKVLEVGELFKEDLIRDEKEIWELAGEPFNIDSPKEVAHVLYDVFKLPAPPPDRDGKGTRSTNKKLLEAYRESYDIVDRIVTHREIAHDMSNYVVGLAKRIDSNFKVHPTIKMFGAVTGRISSENPSIMNIKRDGRAKEIFVAEPGRYLAEFDLKGAELRWYCIYAQDEVLRDILINGYKGNVGVDLTQEQRTDPHFIIGAIAYGPDRAKALRVVAKMTVFGRLYLRGLESIERQYGKETARRLVDVMDDIIPNHHKYVDGIKKQVKEKGYVESYFGRQRRWPLITPENKHEIEKQATNMPIQSASSDLNLLNLVSLWEAKERWDAFPLFTVHDSILVDIPSPDVIPEIKAFLEDNARRIVEGKMEFIYDVKWGTNWAGHKPEGAAR
jgi:DNA polymerase-1